MPVSPARIRTKTYVKDGFHSSDVAQAHAQGKQDRVLLRALRAFVLNFLRRLRVPDRVPKERPVERDLLGGLLERRIDEHDPDWSGALEQGKQGRGDEAPERVSDDDIIRRIVVPRNREEWPELLRQRGDGIVRTAPGIAVSE